MVTLGLRGDPGAEQAGTRLPSRLRSKIGIGFGARDIGASLVGAGALGRLAGSTCPRKPPGSHPTPPHCWVPSGSCGLTLPPGSPPGFPASLGPLGLLWAHAASRKHPWFSPAAIAWYPRAPVGSRCTALIPALCSSPSRQGGGRGGKALVVSFPASAWPKPLPAGWWQTSASGLLTPNLQEQQTGPRFRMRAGARGGLCRWRPGWPL